MQTQQHSFFLNSGGHQLAATALLPANISGAVLFLLPFAEERKGVLPFYLEVARNLHRNNIASLIFDWQGSGDSTGDFESIDPNEFPDNIDSALQWIQETLPGTPVTALGTRLSATLLTQLTSHHAAIQRLVLIAPAAGAEFMHQLLQRRMVNDMVAYGKATESRATMLEKLSTGSSVDLDGFIFSARMYKWITAIRSQELGVRSQESCVPPSSSNYGVACRRQESGVRNQVESDIQLPTSNVQHTLIISGGHSPKTFREIADQTDSAGISEIRFPPFWNTVGHVDLSKLTEEVIHWIIAGFPADSRPVQLPVFCSQSTAFDLIEISVKESTIRATIDKPAGEPAAGVLFLPGWSGDRTGPHRIFTQLARELTRSGHLCMRPDFRGRGLSEGFHADATIHSMAEDAGDALTALRQLLPQDAPAYVAAICSGCKVAVTLAAAHPEISKLLLLSAESMGSLRSSKTDANKTQTALRTYLKKLTQIETWKKILSGKVQTKMVTKALVQHESRSADEAKREDQTLRLFEKFANPVHFVFGGSDPDAPGSMQAYTEYCTEHSIPYSLHLIPHAGHSYYSTEWTKDVFETSIDFFKDLN